MKIYDITQEVFSCNVFPGDTGPSYKQVAAIKDGAVCNLSTIEMGVHNGTHLDAPWHFIDEGKKIDEIDLEKCVGPAIVIQAAGDIEAMTIRRLYDDNPAAERILFKGDCRLTLNGAKELIRLGAKLIGVEAQSVSSNEDPVPVHNELLSNEIVILEGLELGKVPESNSETKYFLVAAPLKLGGRDGSPCRAILINMKNCRLP
ncbi:MAG: cyclase family protein [Lachnospiraceae bacterium]|nr:cyclase family protein [Lachnospiraceae bacterium]